MWRNNGKILPTHNYGKAGDTPIAAQFRRLLEAAADAFLLAAKELLPACGVISRPSRKDFAEKYENVLLL